MVVNKKAKEIYNNIFEGVETRVANIVSDYTENKLLRRYMTNEPIPKEFINKYNIFWKKYFNKRQLKEGVNYAWYYASQNGNHDCRYISNTIYYTKIDQFFNNRKLGWGFNDKNYYSKIFYNIKQPETLVRKVGNSFLDENYRIITLKNAIKIIENEDEVICKPTLETGSGRNISFWKIEKDKSFIIDFLKNNSNKDYIIQRIIEQHEDLNKIHSSSINTIRICSLILNNKVNILSSCLRMGTGNARVDNVTAGGISCGINNDGFLDKYAYSYYTGKKYCKHPQGFTFYNAKVPSFDKAVNLVKNAHQIIPHFRLVSWDIAIDKYGEPILIEPNMRKGGINLHQFSNGPLFGELTEIVMDEVYGYI